MRRPVHRQAGLGRHAQRRGDHVGQGRRITNRRQLDQPHPIGELAHQLGRDLHRQAGLADPAHPGERHQPMGPHQLDELLHLRLRVRRSWSSAPVGCLARRPPSAAPRTRAQGPRRSPGTVGSAATGHAADAHPDRPAPPPTPTPRSRPPRGSDRRAPPPSPAPPGSTSARNSRRRVRSASPVATPIRTGNSNPHCALHRRVDRGASRPERSAHAITGVLEQPAPMAPDRRTQHLVMGSESRPHALGVRLPPARRTLDIREQEGHRPRRRPNPHSARSYAPAGRPRPDRRVASAPETDRLGGDVGDIKGVFKRPIGAAAVLSVSNATAVSRRLPRLTNPSDCAGRAGLSR